jgi:hypothetical protein
MADPRRNNIGAFVAVRPIYGDTMTAAGTGDNTERTSGDLNVQDHGSGSVVIAGRTNCAAGQQLNATIKVAFAPDNGSGAAGTYGTETTILNATKILDGSASAQNFAYKQDVDFDQYRVAGDKFARVKITLDLSAGATDTAQWGASLVCGGARTLPAA